MPRPTSRRTTPSPIVADAPEQDVLDQYLAELHGIPLLTAAEERELAVRSKGGDEEARQELVRRNVRFVVSVAKKYQNRGLPLTDLIGEGNTGLLHAATKFDPDQGVKFISYAVWWIRQAILASLARHSRSVRVPLNRAADLSKVQRATEILRQRLLREPTAGEVATITGLGEEIVIALQMLQVSDVRLDAPIASDEDRTVGERLMDEEADPEAMVLEAFQSEAIARAIETLPPRDAKVLRLYFGMDGGREHTLEEIGSMLGVTRERVRQLRDRALGRLGQGATGEALRSFHAA